MCGLNKIGEEGLVKGRIFIPIYKWPQRPREIFRSAWQSVAGLKSRMNFNLSLLLKVSSTLHLILDIHRRRVDLRDRPCRCCYCETRCEICIVHFSRYRSVLMKWEQFNPRRKFVVRLLLQYFLLTIGREDTVPWGTVSNTLHYENQL